MQNPRKKLALTYLAFLFLLPGVSHAHSFGVLYNLPVPFWMYLYGGAAAMVVSFLFIAYFFDRKHVPDKKGHEFSYPIKDISGSKFVKYITSKNSIIIFRYLAFFLFLLTLVTGIFGQNSSYVNFNMNFFWIIFVLGFTYLVAIVGNIYSAINPLKTITDWVAVDKELSLLKYPEKLGYYPALIFYFIFIWIELMVETTPHKLSLILLVYIVINTLGVLALGNRVWFRYCEFFSVFFRLIGKIAPFEYKEGKLFLRPPFMGLLKRSADHFSLLLFILFMLSSTAFDGFRETIPYFRFYWGYVDEVIRPIFGTDSYRLFGIVALAFSPFIFLFIYLSLIQLAKVIAKSVLPLKDMALKFAFSLIPIAFVYNIAHYFTLIFSEGTKLLSLISDPFGFGWNLFGTANYSNGFILGANFIWHAQVVFILIGHIASVYLMHVVALSVFPSEKKAFLSQLPMLILMVLYTMIGLWILSQPITGGTL